MKKVTLSAPAQAALEAREARFARRIADALTERLAAQPTPDIDTRLRFAREQAVSRAGEVRRELAMAGGSAIVGHSGSTAVLGSPDDNGTPWWLRLSLLLPLAVLLAGLFWIDYRYTQAQIETAVEVDAALLADDLPPEAYRDPGFVEFLKSGRR